MENSEVFDKTTESVVSEDATVEAVIAEETVNNTADAVVEVEETEVAEVPELIEMPIKEIVFDAPKVVVEEVKEEVIVESKFVLKLGHNLWFQSWRPYKLCSKKADALVLDADWARGYTASIKMMKHITAEIVKL